PICPRPRAVPREVGNETTRVAAPRPRPDALPAAETPTEAVSAAALPRPAARPRAGALWPAGVARPRARAVPSCCGGISSKAPISQAVACGLAVPKISADEGTLVESVAPASAQRAPKRSLTSDE